MNNTPKIFQQIKSNEKLKSKSRKKNSGQSIKLMQTNAKHDKKRRKKSTQKKKTRQTSNETHQILVIINYHHQWIDGYIWCMSKHLLHQLIVVYTLIPCLSPIIIESERKENFDVLFLSCNVRVRVKWESENLICFDWEEFEWKEDKEWIMKIMLQ